MRFDELLVLGRTVPEDSKKYGQRVCMAAFDMELRQLVRIYPLPVSNPFKAGCVYRNVSVRRNEADSRRESWRLIDSSIPERLKGAAFTVAKRVQIIAGCEDIPKTIASANERKASLAFLSPDDVKPVELEQKPAFARNDERLLFGDSHRVEHRTQFMTASDYSQCMYVRFVDNGQSHRLQLREWGCYELMRKRKANAWEITKQLKYLEQSRAAHLLIGNMVQHRNVWLVISVMTELVEPVLF